MLRSQMRGARSKGWALCASRPERVHAGVRPWGSRSLLRSSRMWAWHVRPVGAVRDALQAPCYDRGDRRGEREVPSRVGRGTHSASVHRCRTGNLLALARPRSPQRLRLPARGHRCPPPRVRTPRRSDPRRPDSGSCLSQPQRDLPRWRRLPPPPMRQPGAPGARHARRERWAGAEPERPLPRRSRSHRRGQCSVDGRRNEASVSSVSVGTATGEVRPLGQVVPSLSCGVLRLRSPQSWDTARRKRVE